MAGYYLQLNVCDDLLSSESCAVQHDKEMKDLQAYRISGVALRINQQVDVQILHAFLCLW